MSKDKFTPQNDAGPIKPRVGTSIINIPGGPSENKRSPHGGIGGGGGGGGFQP